MKNKILSGWLANGFRRPLIAGIVNATGDSFSEGGASRPETAAERAFRLLDNGADLLDIGGESTRPGAQEVSPEEELRRVLPVVEQVLSRRPQAVISVDTRHSRTAEAVLQAGASIINDVSMLRFDDGLADVVAGHQAALVLCHSRGTPETMRSTEYTSYPDGVAETVRRELESQARMAFERGVAQVIYDPGFGFAKTAEQNWQLMRDLEKLSGLGMLFVGVSRKSFIGLLTGEGGDPMKRLPGTLACELAAVQRGAAIIRTHDAGALRQALAVYRACGMI